MKQSDYSPEDAPPDIWERECARRTLLMQLGIQPLVSRVDGVAAAPAVRLAIPPATLNAVTTSIAPTGEMKGAALRELLRGDGASFTSSEQAPTSDQVISEATREPTTTAASSSLRCYSL